MPACDATKVQPLEPSTRMRGLRQSFEKACHVIGSGESKQCVFLLPNLVFPVVQASSVGCRMYVCDISVCLLLHAASCTNRYGVVNWDYNWDESDSEEDRWYDDNSAAGNAELSPRSARMLQLQQQQAGERTKKGPKVLKPEGHALLRPNTPPTAAGTGTAQNAGWSRSTSPIRSIPEPYQLPTESDDLAAVVRTFLQHEVLKYGRRSKLAGSSLGIRRARDKPAAFQGWQVLPAGSHL